MITKNKYIKIKSNKLKFKKDTEDLNISNEDEFQKEIEAKLNLFKITSSEDENLSNNINDCSKANKDLECNKDDFQNFFKLLENSTNKNFSNFNNNNDETYSEESDLLNEFHDYNNTNFNIKNHFNPNYNYNLNDINPQKRHSHPVNNFIMCNNHIKNIQSIRSQEYSNITNIPSNNDNNNNKDGCLDNINNNFNCNFASKAEQNFSTNSNTNKNQFTKNPLIYLNAQSVNRMKNFNLNSNFNNLNNLNCKDNQFCNFPNIPYRVNETRKNSNYMPYLQEESDNSIESNTCNNNMNANAPFNNQIQIQENLIAYHNFNENRRNSFNCINNKANILCEDLFYLSPKKGVLDPQQHRKSLVYPSLTKSANYFNTNLMPTGEIINSNTESILNCNTNTPYNFTMMDYFSNNKNNIEPYYNNINFKPNIYALPGNNFNRNMKNYMQNNQNNSANFNGMNFYNAQAQAQTALKMPNASDYLFNNSNVNINHRNSFNNNINNPNCALNNINTNNSNNINHFNNSNNTIFTSAKNSQNKLSQPHNQKAFNKNQTSNTVIPSIMNPNLLQIKKSKITNTNQAAGQPDPNSFDDNYLIEYIRNSLKDQNGCRLLQKRIEEKKYDLIIAFYNYIVKGPNFIDIVNDQFGNYVIQKFLEVIFKDKLIMTTFFVNIQAEIFSVSVDLYGTRVFQKALDLLEKNYLCIENVKINEVLKNLVLEHMMELIVDTNGNHVFMKVIGIYPIEKNEFIYDELFKRCYEIAKMKQGGTVFQKAFEQGTKCQKVILFYFCYILKITFSFICRYFKFRINLYLKFLPILMT